jgi:hypothetical protein
MQFTLRYEPDEIDEPYKGGYNGDKSGEIDEGMWELPRQKKSRDLLVSIGVG